MLRSRGDVGLSGSRVPREEIVEGASRMGIGCAGDVGQPRKRIVDEPIQRLQDRRAGADLIGHGRHPLSGRRRSQR